MNQFHRPWVKFLLIGLTGFAAFLAMGMIGVSMKGLPQVANAQTLPVITLNQSNWDVQESVGNAVVTVRINSIPAASSPVTLTYSTFDGTAINGAGADYIAKTGTLTFTSASTILTKQFPVKINDDSISESDETIVLILQSVQNATFGSPSTGTITIQDNDPTPTPTGAAIIYADAKEPNNSFNNATDVSSDAPALCNLTLWPIGDVDYFRFNGKAGSSYEIFTTGLSSGLDTFMRVYGPSLNLIATNDDDGNIGSRASSVTITANVAGFYYIEITNVDPSDPTGKVYCLEINEIPDFTPTPSRTPLPGEDDCEFNSTFDNACLIGVDEPVNLSFVPSLSSQQDTDILKLWVLPGVYYTCETFNLSSVTDTNIILFDQNTNPFSPWIGNADREPGDPSSEVSYLATYKGYIYIMIGPEHIPPKDEASQHTYSAQCTAILSTPTPTPLPFIPPVGGGSTPVPTVTPFEFPTPVPTPTPIDLSFLTAVPPTPPIILFEPLPTPTAVSGGAQIVTINITLYYDANQNFMPELIEGIMDAAVALYDNATGQLISFGSTNEAGMAQFNGVNAAGALRVDVPFLNYSQIVLASNSEILIRVAPQPLPIGIP